MSSSEHNSSSSFKYIWDGSGSLKNGLAEVLQGAEPSPDLLRVIDLRGSMAAECGQTFGFSYLNDVLGVLRLGTVLDDISCEITFDPFREVCQNTWRSMGATALADMSVPFDDMAEASAVALLQRCGWKVEKLKSSNTERKPDLLAVHEDNKVEIEVVASQQKDDEKRRQEAVLRRIEQVPRRDKATIAIHIVDQLTDDEAEKVIYAAKWLDVGKCEEVRDRWVVSIIPSEQQDASDPYWWPKQYFQPFVTSVQVGSGQPRRVTIRWGLSYGAYRNSVLRKIDRSQFSGALPALIAWDTAELKGGVRWLADRGHNLFGEINNHVSGILAFGLETWMDGRVVWRYLLLENLRADKPLPEKMLPELSGEISVRMYSWPA